MRPSPTRGVQQRLDADTDEEVPDELSCFPSAHHSSVRRTT